MNSDPRLIPIYTEDIELIPEVPTRRAPKKAAQDAFAAAIAQRPAARQAKVRNEEPARNLPTKVLGREALVESEKPATFILPMGTDDLEKTRLPPPVAEHRTPRTASMPAVLAPAFLYVARGPGAGRAVPVSAGRMVIGRSSSAGVRVSHPSVSRQHAVVRRAADRFYLRDCGSHNGTFLNGKAVIGEIEIFTGDEISMGQVSLVLRAEAPNHAPRQTALIDRTGFRAGIFGGAVVVGLAVVFFAVRARPVEPAAPLVKVAAPAIDEAKATVGHRAEEEIAAPEPVKAVAKAEPRKADLDLAGPEISATRVFEQTKAAKPAKKVATRAAPASASTGDNKKALALFQAGDVDGALSAASGKVKDTLRLFRDEVAAAKADVSFKDGAGAVKHYTKAIDADASLSKGRAKPVVEAKQALGKLFYMAGLQAVENGDSDRAAGYLTKALKYDPSNAKAKSYLKRLSGPAKSEDSDAKAAADAAFGD